MNTIGFNARGPATRELQKALKKHGYKHLVVDGIYGPETKEAVRNLQKEHGLNADGIAGPNVFEVLGLPRDFLKQMLAKAKKSSENEKTDRCRIFISYSRRDKRWLEKLRTHLRPLEKQFDIDIWDDSKIQTGTLWLENIQQALETAKGAILLISKDFLSSDFITSNELPLLLKAAAEKGATILPVIVTPCRFVETKELSKFQSVNLPERPLSGMSPTKQDEMLLKVSKEVEQILERASSQAHANGKKRSGSKVQHAGSVSSSLPSPPSKETSFKELKFFESSGDYGLTSDWLRLLENTHKAFDMLGIGLGAWRRTSNFRNIVLQKARAGCRVRILMMHKDNPVVRHLVHPEVHGESYESVISDVEQNYVYYKNLEQESKNIEVRQMMEVAPNFYLTRTDGRAIIIQYLHSAPWGNGPLWECSSDFELYNLVKTEFDTLWEHAVTNKIINRKKS
jgi:peptidoglycan hydrolase-like protein with peptidoglycan-binding domain